jgi:hypothetical protein
VGWAVITDRLPQTLSAVEGYAEPSVGKADRLLSGQQSRADGRDKASWAGVSFDKLYQNSGHHHLFAALQVVETRFTRFESRLPRGHRGNRNDKVSFFRAGVGMVGQRQHGAGCWLKGIQDSLCCNAALQLRSACCPWSGWPRSALFGGGGMPSTKFSCTGEAAMHLLYTTPYTRPLSLNPASRSCHTAGYLCNEAGKAGR